MNATLEARLWREVCQHLDLDESVQRLAALLAEHIPLDALLIRRLDPDPLRLTTVAAGRGRLGDRVSPPTRTDLDGAAANAVRAFFEAARPVTLGDLRLGERVLGGRAPHSATDRALSSALVPRGITGRVVAMPLAVAGQTSAVALLALDPSASASTDPNPAAAEPETDPDPLLELLAAAAAPLAVAFDNDRRLHELARMRQALEADRDALLTRLQRQDLSGVVIGESGGLQGTMARVGQVAPTDAPVLILGETGSGKEVIARAIHARSRRAKAPIVRINCGAIPSELIDSELFGHERGAFTGAVGTRQGWFERADGGTLFLDEIGELPPAAQVRLLRVLQDGTLERVGGTRTIGVDVRIVAATHRHLEAMVAEGRFREDLWYRLCVFPIRLPALRERVEDLPALAAHFADRAGRRLGGLGLAPTAADLDLLRGYAWPGNVRELAAVIERAVILGNGRRLELTAALGATTIRPAPIVTPMPSTPMPSTPMPSTPMPSSPDAMPEATPKPTPPITLDEAIAAHIRQALAACQGRIEGPFGAARVLGINPHTLRARMRKLGVDWARFRPPGP